VAVVVQPPQRGIEWAFFVKRGGGRRTRLDDNGRIRIAPPSTWPITAGPDESPAGVAGIGIPLPAGSFMIKSLVPGAS